MEDKEVSKQDSGLSKGSRMLREYSLNHPFPLPVGTGLVPVLCQALGDDGKSRAHGACHLAGETRLSHCTLKGKKQGPAK